MIVPFTMTKNVKRNYTLCLTNPAKQDKMKKTSIQNGDAYEYTRTQAEMVGKTDDE